MKRDLRGTLIAVLAHSVPCMKLEDFLGHPAVAVANEEDVQQAVDSLLQEQMFESGVTEYAPRYGATLYYMADNDAAQQAFRMARARG